MAIFVLMATFLLSASDVESRADADFLTKRSTTCPLTRIFSQKSCTITSQLVDDTGIRVGDGSTCWQRNGQAKLVFRCLDGTWKRIAGDLRRAKRSELDKIMCPENVTVTPPEGKTCAIVTWTPPNKTNSHTGGQPGDCFPSGTWVIFYANNGFWNINSFASSCSFQINVNDICSWPKDHCWPGDCRNQLTANCVCRQGFRLRHVDNGTRCELDSPPILSTCRVSVVDQLGNVKNSSYAGSLANCESQQDEFIRTQPRELNFVTKANLDLPLGSLPYYVSSSKAGVVGGQITLVKKSVTGPEIIVRDTKLNGPPFCQVTVNSTRPLIGSSYHDCEGSLNLSTVDDLLDGESLCADMGSLSGGYYNLQSDTGEFKGQFLFGQLQTRKRVCFHYDDRKPIHCFENGCNASPLLLSSRTTRVPSISALVDGWIDPVPQGGSNISASLIDRYRVEVHRVNVGLSSLSVQDGAIEELTVQWDANGSAQESPYNITVTLPTGPPCLYALILEVHDHAGNVRYGRRLVMFDNSSRVELNDSWSLRVTSADLSSQFRWQTNISRNLCADWRNRFYNDDIRFNLQPIQPDTGREIEGQYDQLDGPLSVNGTDNTNGVIKFELSWNRGPDKSSAWTTVTPTSAQFACVDTDLQDGETYTIWIRATDIMNNSNEDSVIVSIDSTLPDLDIAGLLGRFGRKGLKAHSNTDLSTILLEIEALDPHSGMKTLHWTLGTSEGSDDVGWGAVGVQVLENNTDCGGVKNCYCPAIGLCQMHTYNISFHNLVKNNSQIGQHHRDYFFAATAINNARLATTHSMTILIDVSPPTMGVVLEGLGEGDEVEMDFTSNDVVPVRWYGFQDFESGILLYRIVLAARCLTREQMNSAVNATEVENGNTAHIYIPSEGRFFTSVVAYNGAMEPSEVACSDGIVKDKSPPYFMNVSLEHARTVSSLTCSRNGLWLVNSNLTRARLSLVNECASICIGNNTVEAWQYLPLSTDHVLSQNLSRDVCRTVSHTTETTYLFLPSDFLSLEWAIEDDESDMEEVYVGLGLDSTTSAAPDLLPFAPTHGYYLYQVQHPGLDQGTEFYIFLYALSKAGLRANLTLGPVIVDATPPEVLQPLIAVIEDGFLQVSWTFATFRDAEQPSGIAFNIFLRIAHTDAFVTPFLSLHDATFEPCQRGNGTQCIRYPVSSLYQYNAPSGRHFFFQFHVRNVAGHVTTVNTSSALLPSILAPSGGTVIDVRKLASISEQLVTSGILEYQDSLWQVQDVDVVMQSSEVCIGWIGFYLPGENVSIEVGVGTLSYLDDVVKFVSVENQSPACFNSSTLLAYTKLLSSVRATSAAGSVVFSSDGFRMVPANDPDNTLEVFHGSTCGSNDTISYFNLSSGEVGVKLTSRTRLHPGDVVFVRIRPFVKDVIFSKALVLYETLTGFQVVVVSANMSLTFIWPLTRHTTIEIHNCLLNVDYLSATGKEALVTWEMSGHWENFVRHFQVKVIDSTCLTHVEQNREYAGQNCVISEAKVRPTDRQFSLYGASLISGHAYISTVSPCLDDACFPATSSSQLIVWDNVQVIVTMEQAWLLAVPLQDMKVEIKASVQPSIAVSTANDTVPECIFLWTIAKDKTGSMPLSEWCVQRSDNCSNIQIRDQIPYNKTSATGTIYACLRPLKPWKSDFPTCHKIIRSASTMSTNPYHIIELSHAIYSELDLDVYLRSEQLGSKLQELYDLDLDFATSDVMLAAFLTDSVGKSVDWFLMRSPRLPASGGCDADAQCVTSQTNGTGRIVFKRTVARLQDGHVYFVCARASPMATDDVAGDTSAVFELCGDGVVIDDMPPVSGEVTIISSNSGYLTDGSWIHVVWSDFKDVEVDVLLLQDVITRTYSVSLGSYADTEDIAPAVPVGQRTAWTFGNVNIPSGHTCIATVTAEDRVGHVTKVSSKQVIIDKTPPSSGKVVVGKNTFNNFVSGRKQMTWEDIEDPESGVKSLEFAVLTSGGQDVIISFTPCTGRSESIIDTSMLVDGHSYVAVIKATNGAGLNSFSQSDPFIVDNSPPGPGVIWNSAKNTNGQTSFSTEVGYYHAYWTGFTDPHSGLAYFRVGLGSQAGKTDYWPLIYVGLQRDYTWKHEFVQGETYYVTVEACNRAGLCRTTSSSSLTFDNSPPTPGIVTVGTSRRHKKFLGYNSAVPVKWIGFSDPQTGIEEFSWCVGLMPGQCNVTSLVSTSSVHAALKVELALPVATPLYVTVRARNPAGLEAQGSSESFIVDLTPPTVITWPYFRSLRDGSAVNNQWDRSVLSVGWKFDDPESFVISSTVNIRSQLSGRQVTEPIKMATNEEAILTLDEEHLLLDGDRYTAAVTACNSAGLCTTAVSHPLLVDSTSPTAGTFGSPLTWITDSEANGSLTRVNVTWHGFDDVESGVTQFLLTAGHDYNGEELSKGQITLVNESSPLQSSYSLTLDHGLTAGESVYLGIFARNTVGLESPIVRVAFEVVKDTHSGLSGTLVSIKHSCKAAYCTKECTCAPVGQVCQTAVTADCRQLNPFDEKVLGTEVFPVLGNPSNPRTYSVSAKCLEGHWRLGNLVFMSNISRFEWSFSQSNMSAGMGVFNAQSEAVWHDVGRNTHVVFCLPGQRLLMSGGSYVLHVRSWLSREEYVTWVSRLLQVDPSPPQIMRGKSVKDSVDNCNFDVDFLSRDLHITGCWEGVFSDPQSSIARYDVWMGTLPYGDDLFRKREAGFNTNWTFPTANMEKGTRYYITVRAWNGAGLKALAVSDGFEIDNVPPTPGVVFASARNSFRHAQSSTTNLLASWHGFEDKDSGLTSFQLAVYDVNNYTAPLVPFHDVGSQTESVLEGLTLKHNHSYKIAVKARDKAGLESDPIESPPVLVDVTPPEGVTCTQFQPRESRNLTYVRSPLMHDSYTGAFSLKSVELNDIIKIAVSASNLMIGAGGFFTLHELSMPLFFTYSQPGNARAEHVLMSPAAGDISLTVVVEGQPGAQVTVTVYVCVQAVVSLTEAITIHQMSQTSISICSRIRDPESGIRHLTVALGTTKGGLQVRPWTLVGHSGHIVFDGDVQHGSPLYATALAENFAGQQVRIFSRPIVMDRTPPHVSGVNVTLRYGSMAETNESLVFVEARWTSEDAESGVVSCFCELKSPNTVNSPRQETTHTETGLCEWRVMSSHHGSSVQVKVTCMNGIQLQTTVTSTPEVILLRPPSLSQAAIYSLYNFDTMSPFEWTDPGVRSAMSVLEFSLRGAFDPTISEVQYRFAQESRSGTSWSSLSSSKTSFILEKGQNTLSGNLTAEVRALNARRMASDVVSRSVCLDDSKPGLTGTHAKIFFRAGDIMLDWQDVFKVNRDVTYSVFAGSAPDFGNVINHVITKETFWKGACPRMSSLFVTILAVYSNGKMVIYKAELGP